MPAQSDPIKRRTLYLMMLYRQWCFQFQRDITLNRTSYYMYKLTTPFCSYRTVVLNFFELAAHKLAKKFGGTPRFWLRPKSTVFRYFQWQFKIWRHTCALRNTGWETLMQSNAYFRILRDNYVFRRKRFFLYNQFGVCAYSFAIELLDLRST
jgi:hypothetical protein